MIDYLDFLIVLGECVGFVGLFGVGKIIFISFLLWFFDVEIG